MALTYEPIATTTLSSSSVSFTSIPQTYTDLRLIIVAYVSSGNSSPAMLFNNNSSAIYSQTTLYGSGSSAGSQANAGAAIFNVGFNGLTTTPHTYDINIFNYTGSTNKTYLNIGSENDNGSGYTFRDVGLYRSTSAITRIDLSNQSGGVPTNFFGTATLYGIKAA